MPNPKSVDYSILPKIDLTFTPIQDQNEIYIQNAYKRVTTKTGIETPPSGQFWSPTTIDLRDYFLDKMSPQKLSILKNRLVEIFQVETRYNVDIDCTFLNSELKVKIILFPVDNPRAIKLIFTVTSSSLSFQRVP